MQVRPGAGVLVALALALGRVAAPTQDAAEAERPAEDVHAAWRARLADDGRRPVLEDTAGLACAECHVAITEEWRHSAHAIAWQDEHYREEVRKVRQKAKCHGCHAPPPIVPAGLPQHPDPRAERRAHGVDCATCHLDADGETVLGPRGETTEAHPARRAAEVVDGGDGSALCVACHATNIGPVIGVAQDFVDTDQAGFDLSCVGCHMPDLHAPAARDPDGEETYPERFRRSHRLESARDPHFLAEAFDLESRVEQGRTALVITNLTGHRVPGSTRRTLRFVARLVDEDGDTVAEGEHAIDHRSYLPVEESVELWLEGTGARLEVEGRHEAEGIRRYQVFLTRTLTP